MALDMKRMRKSYDENQKGGDLWTPDQGATRVYIHGQCRQDDEFEPTVGTNLIPLTVHYNVGKDNAMVVCLDVERNPIMKHPFIRDLLKKRGVKVGKKCPVCEAIDEGELTPEDADESAPSSRFLWGLTPVGYKHKSSDEKFMKVTPKPSVALVGATLYNGFMDLFFSAGDITDLDAMVFAVVTREGKGRFDTKYDVSIDIPTTKKPMKAPAGFRSKILKAVRQDGDCDLFRITANMIKSTDEITALLAGVRTSSGSDDDDLDDGDAGLDDDLGDDDLGDLGDDDLDDGDIDSLDDEDAASGDEDDLTGDDTDLDGDGDDDTESGDGIDDDLDDLDADLDGDLDGLDDGDAEGEDIEGEDTEGSGDDELDDGDAEGEDVDDLDALDAELERISAAKKKAEAKKASAAKGKGKAKGGKKGGTTVAKKRNAKK